MLGRSPGGLGGPVKAIREASPQARHHFTQADRNQLAALTLHGSFSHAPQTKPQAGSALLCGGDYPACVGHKTIDHTEREPLDNFTEDLSSQFELQRERGGFVYRLPVKSGGAEAPVGLH